MAIWTTQSSAEVLDVGWVGLPGFIKFPFPLDPQPLFSLHVPIGSTTQAVYYPYGVGYCTDLAMAYSGLICYPYGVLYLGLLNVRTPAINFS